MKRKLTKYIDDTYFSYGDTKYNIHDITDFFIIQNKKLIEVVEHFNLGSVSNLCVILNHYGIKKPGSKRSELTKKGCLEKYGVTCSSKSDVIKEKVKKRNLEKYGVEYPAQLESTQLKKKETNLKRYGFNNPMKSLMVKEKLRNTSKERYGTYNPAKSDIIKDKIRLNYYGKEVFDILNDKMKLKNIILSIPIEFRTIKNIGIKIGLDKFDFQWTRVITYLEKYDFMTDKNLGIIPRTSNHSQPELEVKEFIQNLGFDCDSTRKILNGKEIDIFLPEKGIGIEFNGDYFHSDQKVPHDYHFEKSKIACENNIRLIHIYQCEWEDPEMQPKIKELLKIALGKTDTKVYARNCEVKKIDNSEAKPFNDKNHLQGHRNAQVTYGLYYKNTLVQLMSFSKNRKYEWEIIRGCPASNNIVVGGVSKLFKHFVREYNPKEVFSYCDFNKFDGKGYEALGMEFIGYTGPDKFYSIKGRKVQRNPYKRTELEGLADFIIYGAGSKKYLWKNPEIKL